MNTDATTAWRRLWPLLPLAALAATGLPLLYAGFHSDDWIWLAIVRHLDHPFAPYVTGILHEYFYRPSSIALWWLGERLAGQHAGGHYLLDLGVHAASCLLLVALLRGWSVRPLPSLLAGGLFALAPAALGTVAWLSNRNELLAVAAGLGALLVLERAPRRPVGLWAVALLLWLSLSSKETGVVFVAAGLLRLLRARRGGVTVTAWSWPALLLPLAGLFLMRRLTLWSTGVSISPADAPAGVAGWWQALPAAMTGFADATAGHAAVVLLALVVVAGAVLGAWAQPRLRLPLCQAGLFLLLPPLLQWPITHLVFADAGARVFTENLRFFYLATAALGMLLAVAADRPARRRRQTATVLAALLVLLPAGWGAQRLVQAWVRSTGHTSAQILALARPVARESYPDGCLVQLEREDWPTAFPTFADAIVKFAAPRGASVLGCAVFTQQPPAHTLLPRRLCSASAWPALTLRGQQGVPVLRPLGNLCLAGFAMPDPAALQDAFRFDLNHPVLPP